MTIETATPSSMETLAGMFDTLVEHVVARVLFKLDASIAARVEHAMDTWASNAVIIDDRITDYVSHTLNLDSKLDEWAMTSGTLEDKITEGVQTAVDNLDLHDQVLEIAQDLTFEVSVSR
jgi:hypothetical protein